MSGNAQRNIAVIGGGPAGLMAAEVIAKAGHRVTVYDRMPSVGRKFLLAGRGGLNLTHGETLESFMRRYGASAGHLRAAIEALPPQHLREWSEALGQKTFEGSSGRIFPEAFKASPLLRAWLRCLDRAGVAFALRHRWQGWDESGALIFDTPKGAERVDADAVVLALGGASWPKLGADGGWQNSIEQRGVTVAPLLPSNCGFTVAWSETFRERFAGTPLKRIEVKAGDATVRGEAVISGYGIEGGAIYALSSHIRSEVLKHDSTTIEINLRPDLSKEEIAAKFSAERGKQTFSNHLRKALNLSPVAIGLLNEWAFANGERLQELPPEKIATLVAQYPLHLTGIAPIASAISTAGGIAFSELDKDFMLRKIPGVFAAGEMLDWEAPTGGYLLQACFSTGAAAGEGVLRWLTR